MVKFKPVELKLTIDEAQLAVLKDIHEAIEEVSKKLVRILPASFPKAGEQYIEQIIAALEQIDYQWKLWVVDNFKNEMNSVEFFKGIGIRRINPWDQGDDD